MFGIISMLYNLICGTAAASNSLTKYQQGQKNLQEALDKGEKIYYDGKGRMRTVGGDFAMRWHDENGHDVIINRTNGAVIRDFTAEEAEDRKEHERKLNERNRLKAIAEKEPYSLYSPVEWPPEKKWGSKMIKDNYGVYWRISNYYIECETKMPYQLEYSYETHRSLQLHYGGVHEDCYYFYFYKQYFNDEKCEQLGKRIALTREEWNYWGGRVYHDKYHDFDYENHRYFLWMQGEHPYHIDVEKERRKLIQ